MEINQTVTAPKKIFFLIFILCVTLLNFNISIFANSHVNVSQIAMALFIAIGFFISRKNLLFTSIKYYAFFIFFILIGTIIGHDHVWFYNDLGKLLLIGSMLFIYLNIFNTRAEFMFFVKATAWLFVAAVVILIPFNLHLIFMSNRLVISSFGKGGEDLGWSAAILYILILSIIPKNFPYFKSGHNILCIALMSILLLSLARSAILSIFVYCLLTRNWRFIWDGIFGSLISIILITFALQNKFVEPNAFLVQNLYRYIPRAIGSKLYAYLLPAATKASTPFMQKTAFSISNAATKKMILHAQATLPVPYAQNWMLTGRSLIWASFLSYFFHADLLHQLLGFGIGSVTMSVKIAGFLSRDPHNLFIDILFNFGLIGLVFFLYAIIRSFVIFARAHLVDSYSILAMIVVSGLVNTLWRFSDALWLTALIAATPYIYLKLFRERK